MKLEIVEKKTKFRNIGITANYLLLKFSGVTTRFSTYVQHEIIVPSTMKFMIQNAFDRKYDISPVEALFTIDKIYESIIIQFPGARVVDDIASLFIDVFKNRWIIMKQWSGGKKEEAIRIERRALELMEENREKFIVDVTKY